MKTEAKRCIIVEAAAALFLENGYNGTTMSAISMRLGGSKETIYGYFASKEELFIHVMLERGSGRFDNLFRKLGDGSDIRSALSAFGDACLRLTLSHEALAFRRMIIAEGPRSELGRLFYESGTEKGLEQLSSFFEGEMQAGHLRSTNPMTAAVHFQALLEAGPYQRRLEGVIDDPSDIEIRTTVTEAIDAFLRAYAAA